MNDASESEINLFRALTNPNRVDFTKKSKSSTTSVVEDAVADELRRLDDDRHSQFHDENDYTYKDDESPPENGENDRPITPPPSPSALPQPSFFTSQPSLFTPPPPSPCNIPDEDPDIKHATLVELNNFLREGVILTRQFTMADSLSDMQFELSRIQSNRDTAQMVGIATDMLQLGMSGVEFANNRWGPVMHLDGWSGVVNTDRARFTNVLTRLYKKYWRRGTSSPELELAMLLGGSAVAHHVNHKLGRSPSSGTPGGGGMFGGMGNLFGAFSNMSSPPAAPTNPQSDTAGGPGVFSQRPPMRRPMPTTPTVPPTPGPTTAATTSAKMARELEEMRAERAVLHAQLRTQSSMAQPAFVVMSSSKHDFQTRGGSSPHIEEL